MTDVKIVAKPFDWKDNMSEIALEDFSMYQKEMSYGASQTIGTALAKLQLMEEQGLYPDILQKIVEKLEKDREWMLEMREIGMSAGLCDAIEIVKEEGGLNDFKQMELRYS